MRRLPFSVLFSLLAMLLLTAPARADQSALADTVIRMPLAPGVSMDDAVDSMLLRANALNFKLAARLPLFKELEAMGIPTKRVEIFQFCDARITAQMIAENLDFAAHLPCRITLIEDQNGQAWLVTQHLDRVIRMTDLPPKLLELATKAQDAMKDIMTAGASGDL